MTGGPAWLEAPPRGPQPDSLAPLIGPRGEPSSRVSTRGECVRGLGAPRPTTGRGPGAVRLGVHAKGVFVHRARRRILPGGAGGAAADGATLHYFTTRGPAVAAPTAETTPDPTKRARW